MAISRKSRKGRSSTVAEHRRRSVAAKRAISKRRRTATGRLKNPFDGLGFWHRADGRYAELPVRGGKAAPKRRKFARKVAAGRKRSSATGRFLNPAENPFYDSIGVRHRNSGDFAMKPGPRKRRGRRNPAAALANPFENPFYDKAGRRHRNDGPFAAKPGPKAKRKPSRSRRARRNPFEFMPMTALANPFMAALPNPSPRRGKKKATRRAPKRTAKRTVKRTAKRTIKRTAKRTVKRTAKRAPKRRPGTAELQLARLLMNGRRGVKRARRAPYGQASRPYARTVMAAPPSFDNPYHRALPAPRKRRR